MTGLYAKLVMLGLVPGIHVLAHLSRKDVDGRVKPGHDEKEAAWSTEVGLESVKKTEQVADVGRGAIRVGG